MKSRAFPSAVAALFAAFTITIQPSASADNFGSGPTSFTIDFVDIGNAGNAADTDGYGAVPYSYRMGKFEIPEDSIFQAQLSGMIGVPPGSWYGIQPSAAISWYEAAAFVNWLNTSTGRQAAYDLTWTGSEWTMGLWSSENAWQLGGENLYRHKDAYYFLPSENEWYKAAYYNPAGTSYFAFAVPTVGVNPPTAVSFGTNAGTAVYNNTDPGSVPAPVMAAGGLSSYGTMGQNGNVWEWMETAFDGTNSSASEDRLLRGGAWFDSADLLAFNYRFQSLDPAFGDGAIGFRVASVPEPSTYALLLMTGAGWLLWRRRKITP